MAPVLVAPDSALLNKCDLPVDLGAGELAQARLEKLWITDRSALLRCYRRHMALRDYYLERDAALRGAA